MVKKMVLLIVVTALACSAHAVLRSDLTDARTSRALAGVEGGTVQPGVFRELVFGKGNASDPIEDMQALARRGGLGCEGNDAPRSTGSNSRT